VGVLVAECTPSFVSARNPEGCCLVRGRMLRAEQQVRAPLARTEARYVIARLLPASFACRTSKIVTVSSGLQSIASLCWTRCSPD
jgi:hypothetical protein